jgi:hypothetical protein
LQQLHKKYQNVDTGEVEKWRITLIFCSTWIHDFFWIRKSASHDHWVKRGWSGRNVTCTALGGVGRLLVTARVERLSGALIGSGRRCPCPFIKRGLSFFLAPCFESARSSLQSTHSTRRGPMSQPCQRWRPTATCITTPTEQIDNLHRESQIRLSRRAQRLLSVARNNCCACWPLTHNRNPRSDIQSLFSFCVHPFIQEKWLDGDNYINCWQQNAIIVCPQLIYYVEAFPRGNGAHIRWVLFM